MKVTYTALIRRKDGIFLLEFPDVKGCVMSASKIDDLLEGAHDLLRKHFEGVTEFPQPTIISCTDVIIEVEDGNADIRYSILSKICSRLTISFIGIKLLI